VQLHLAASGAESINARGETVRPGTAGRVPLKREPGIGQPGQTGTAARQRAAANERAIERSVATEVGQVCDSFNCDRSPGVNSRSRSRSPWVGGGSDCG